MDNPEDVPMGLWAISAFFAVLCLPLLFFGWQMARSAWRAQAGVVTMLPASTPVQLSARSRNAILATIFLFIGTPLSVLLLIHVRSGVELVYRTIAGIALFAIGVRLAWVAWRKK